MCLKTQEMLCGSEGRSDRWKLVWGVELGSCPTRGKGGQ